MAPLKVLVVDDDRSIRSLLRIAFSVEERVGEVREAEGGAEALALCESFTPDVVFLDYWMPFMAGDAVAARLRVLHPRARIIAFSGVLESTPEWADGLCVKGDLPDIGLVIDVTEG